MDPKHLIYLACVFDKGSITSAAEHLGLAQPTLTRAIATLEMQAGSQLFSRSRYGVKSTPIGDALAREGRTIIHTMSLAREQVSRYKLGLNSELRIASGPLLGLGVMPEIVDNMTRTYPNTALTVTTTTPLHGIEAIKNDEFDVFLAPSPDERVFKGIQRQLVARDQIAIYCGKDHPLAHQKNISSKDFESADWLSLGMSNTFERAVLEMLMRAGINNIRTKVGFRNDAAILMRLLSRGRYLSVLPRIPVLAIDTNDQVIELNFDLGDAVHRDLYLWAREEVLDTPAFKAFATITNEVFSQVQNKQLH